MAVGYERLNTSAARSKRVSAKEIPRSSITITPAGARLLDPTYGAGTTLEEFVSESDSVRCRFDSGVIVTLRGSAVRCGIVDAGKQVR